MKDIFKNPILYYVFVPIIAAIWPLLLWGTYLPKTERNWQNEKNQYNKAQKIMTEVLNLDPDRLQFADSKNNAAEFDYADAVEKVARLCGILPSNYTISSRPITTSSKQKSQSARIELMAVDITKFAKFVSTIQLRWTNLQCEQVKLTRKKGVPDQWDVDLDFKYYY